jgi:hypothetical protein
MAASINDHVATAAINGYRYAGVQGKTNGTDLPGTQSATPLCGVAAMKSSVPSSPLSNV